VNDCFPPNSAAPASCAPEIFFSYRGVGGGSAPLLAMRLVSQSPSSPSPPLVFSLPIHPLSPTAPGGAAERVHVRRRAGPTRPRGRRPLATGAPGLGGGRHGKGAPGAWLEVRKGRGACARSRGLFDPRHLLIPPVGVSPFQSRTGPCSPQGNTQTPQAFAPKGRAKPSRPFVVNPSISGMDQKSGRVGRWPSEWGWVSEWPCRVL